MQKWHPADSIDEARGRPHRWAAMAGRLRPCAPSSRAMPSYAAASWRASACCSALTAVLASLRACRAMMGVPAALRRHSDNLEHLFCSRTKTCMGPRDPQCSLSCCEPRRSGLSMLRASARRSAGPAPTCGHVRHGAGHCGRQAHCRAGGGCCCMHTFCVGSAEIPHPLKPLTMTVV